MFKKKVNKSIEFSNGNGYVILKTNKEDLDFINDKYGLNNSPATYLVIGDINTDKKNINYYVGESSVNVMSRLDESFQKRPWINEIYIVISPSGLLTMEIVKTLEYMFLQTMRGCLLGDDQVNINTNNADCGVVGYRAQLGFNSYTSLIKDIYTLFFSDVIVYSKYSIYFNNFEIEPLMTKNCKVCYDRNGQICSTFLMDSDFVVMKNSILRIDDDTLSNAGQSVKLLFKSLLDSKQIYPILVEDCLYWSFLVNKKLPAHTLNDFIKLSTDSLNSTITNSVLSYSRFVKKFVQ